MSEPTAVALGPAELTRGARAASTSRSGAARFIKPVLLGTLALYLGGVLVAPLVALVFAFYEAAGAGGALLLLEPDALRALGITLSLVVIAAVVNALVGTVGAIAITRHRFPLRHVVDALADLPLAVSPVMIGLAFLLLFGRDGVLAPVLEGVGVQVVFAYPALVVATLFVTLPYTLREVVYLLEQLGTSEEEAAVTLGASQLRVFWHVTLPNIRPALGYGLLMAVARTFGEFGAVLVLGGSISGKTQTATTFIHDAIEERLPAAAYTMAALLSAISVALLLLLERIKQRRKAASCTSASRA